MYYVYIVRCNDGTLYTGITTNIDRRINEHNGELTGGAKYTTARSPVLLEYSAVSPDRSSASIEESRIKKLTKVNKEIFIRNNCNK
jgi:putative endonuclease